MKQKDLSVILVVVFVSAAVSVFASHMLFASAGSHDKQATVVQSISTNFPQADTTYFNPTSVDPAQLIRIGTNTNTNPFNGNGQQ